jgi:hypothetical protein
LVSFENIYQKPDVPEPPVITDNCTARIESITNEGLVSIRFSEPLVKVDPSRLTKDILEIYVEPTGIDLTLELQSLNLTWQVVRF